MLVVLSPKSHNQDVTLPLVVFVNVTFTGAVPLVGVIVKLVTGAAATTLIAVVAVLVTLPPEPVAVKLTV